MPASNLARVLAIPLLLVPFLAACGQGQSQTPAAAPPPPQVTVAKPTSKLITDQDEYVGRFVAVDSVEVRARVSGYLDAIHFRDGQMVNKEICCSPSTAGRSRRRSIRPRPTLRKQEPILRSPKAIWRAARALSALQ